LAGKTAAACTAACIFSKMASDRVSAAALLAMAKEGVGGEQDDINKALLEAWLDKARAKLQDTLITEARKGEHAIIIQPPTLTNPHTCKDGVKRWRDYEYEAYMDRLLDAPLKDQLQAMVGEGVRVESIGGRPMCGREPAPAQPEKVLWTFRVSWGAHSKWDSNHVDL
jgi:hypothetical protein